MDCVGRNWPRAGPAHTPNKIEAPTHNPPASHRHRPRLREHSHSSSVFTGASCCSRSSTSAKLRAGGLGEGNGECESSQVVSGDAVRQSPGSTPLGRSMPRRGDAGVGWSSARCASGIGEGVPRARGRRVQREADPGGYYLSARGGRGRLTTEAGERAGGQSDPPALAASAGAANEPRSELQFQCTWACNERRVRFQRKRPDHAPLLRERARSTPRRTQQPAQGPSGVTAGVTARGNSKHRKTSARAQPSRRGAPAERWGRGRAL